MRRGARLRAPFRTATLTLDYCPHRGATQMRFEVPCECGRRLCVTAGDAGATLKCACGRPVEVPNLNELRASAPPSEPKPARATRDLSWLRLVGPLVIVASIVWENLSQPRPGMDSNAIWNARLYAASGFLFLYAVGNVLWAAGKGYRPLVGMLLAVLGPLGLFVLLFFPSRTNRPDSP